MVKQFIIAILVFLFTALEIGAVKGANLGTSMGNSDNFGNPFSIHTFHESDSIR